MPLPAKLVDLTKCATMASVACTRYGAGRLCVVTNANCTSTPQEATYATIAAASASAGMSTTDFDGGLAVALIIEPALSGGSSSTSSMSVKHRINCLSRLAGRSSIYDATSRLRQRLPSSTPAEAQVTLHSSQCKWHHLIAVRS